MRTYFVEALIDGRKGNWVSNGPQRRQGRFQARDRVMAEAKAVAFWGKGLNNNESVVIKGVRPL